MARPITGRTFFLIFAIPFVVIIAVNVFLAVNAVRTFPGLEVENSYVASQTFDVTRAAQLALGWDVSAEVEGGDELVLRILKDGQPVPGVDVSGIFGRATSVRDDQQPEFRFEDGAYRAPVVTAGGNWNLRLKAIAPDGTPFQQRVLVPVH